MEPSKTEKIRIHPSIISSTLITFFFPWSPHLYHIYFNHLRSQSMIRQSWALTFSRIKAFLSKTLLSIRIELLALVFFYYKDMFLRNEWFPIVATLLSYVNENRSGKK